MKQSKIQALHQDKKSYWKQIMEDWQRSGISQQQYCEIKKINFHTFSYWRGHLKGESDEKAGAVKTINKFMPITIVSNDEIKADEELILYLRNGRKIKISKGFDEETLQRLMRCADV